MHHLQEQYIELITLSKSRVKNLHSVWGPICVAFLKVQYVVMGNRSEVLRGQEWAKCDSKGTAQRSFQGDGMVICILSNDDYANLSIYYDSKDCAYNKSHFCCILILKMNKMSHKYKDKIKNVKFVQTFSTGLKGSLRI